MQLGVLLQEMKDGYLINPLYNRFWQLMEENNYHLSGTINDECNYIEIRLDNKGNIKFRKNTFTGIKPMTHQWLIIYTLYYDYRNRKNPVLCMDCGKPVFRDKGDYYMVNDSLWKKATKNPNEERCLLCKKCLEKRIGRELKLDDYKQYIDAPINDFLFNDYNIVSN